MFNEYGNVIENADLQNYNTYKIKTSCNYLVFPNSIEKLQNTDNCVRTSKLK